MNDYTPHEDSLLMNVANHLCKGDNPHEGQRVVIWDDHDNLVEETPPCEDHIRMADIARRPLGIACGIGIQQGFSLGTGEEVPFELFINTPSPYGYAAYRDDFNNFKFEEKGKTDD